MSIRHGLIFRVVHKKFDRQNSVTVGYLLGSKAPYDLQLYDLSTNMVVQVSDKVVVCGLCARAQESSLQKGQQTKATTLGRRRRLRLEAKFTLYWREV